MKKKKKKKINKKNLIMFIILMILTTILVFSSINIIKWAIDYHRTKNQNTENLANITEIDDNKNTEIIKQKNIKKSDPYWDFIKTKLINVDFTKLKKKNNETVGWIQVKNTNVNYPFVQAKDNDFYLNHSFDKSYNQGGWVFLDYRNNTSLENRNTIIYAHGMYNNTMFGSLRSIVKSEWMNNESNYIVRLSTEYENTLWQVFSVYHIPTTSDYLQIDFSSNQEFQTFANKLLKRSYHNFNTTVSETDNILTLSTCYNKKETVVLHAKLIKKEER